VDDHDSLARHALSLLGDASLVTRLTAAAHSTCDAYTWPRVREQWLHVYRSLLANRGLEAAAITRAQE
jgi:hypothetical protein